MVRQSQIVSQEEINRLAEAVDQATANVLEEGIQINFEELKAQAQHFVLNYDILAKMHLNNLMGQYKAALVGQENSSGTMVIQKIKNMSNANRLFQNSAYALAFQFDAYLSNFRQELPREVAYVHIGSDGKPEAYSVPLNQLQMLVNSKGQILPSANVLKRYGTLESELLNKQQELQNEEKDQNRHISVAQSAYIGTSKRLDRFREKYGRSGQTNGLIMWNLNKIWYINVVNGYGDIKEAYVAALMTKHMMQLDHLCRVKDIGDVPFYSHELISTFFNDYVTKVTALAAIVEEDVVTDVRQIAVKGSYGSWPSLTQYLDVAKEIIKADSQIVDLKTLENYIRTNNRWNNDTQRNRLIGTVENECWDAYYKLVNDFKAGRVRLGSVTNLTN